MRKMVEINGKKVPLGVARLGKPRPGFKPHRVLCPVCEKYAFAERDNYDVCPFCGWENEQYQYEHRDNAGGANHVSVNEAIKNYKKFGAKDKESIPLVKALREQFEKGISVPNATMCMHINEYVEDADPVKMIKNS